MAGQHLLWWRPLLSSTFSAHLQAPGSKAAPGSSRLSMGGAGPHNRYSTAAGLVSGGSAAAAQGLHGSDIQTLASKKNVVTAALNKLQVSEHGTVNHSHSGPHTVSSTLGHCIISFGNKQSTNVSHSGGLASLAPQGSQRCAFS
jgi:hypothetical protein